MNFEDIKNSSDEYFMPTYARFDVAIESAKGSKMVDVNGKEYIDFSSGIGVNSLGHVNDGWVNAVKNQIDKLSHVSNLYHNPTTVECAKMLCEKSGFDKVFFANSGAEANEAAIKLARKYSFDKYGQDRATIITLYDSFHGRTISTLAATGQDSFHNYFFPFTAGFKYAQKNIESVLEQLDDTVCAIMMEPIQGEGGVMPLEKEFVEKVWAICQEKDILLIFDEVQTGIGRTGKLYAWENYGIRPDVLTSAKGLAGGLPIGACLCKKEFGNVLGAGMHGTTFGGNPVACAGAIEVLTQVCADGFLEEVAKKGEILRSTIKNMQNVKEVRGMGMMIGVVIENSTAKEVVVKCIENGLILLTAKDLVRLLPPLTTTQEEIESGLKILENCLKS